MMLPTSTGEQPCVPMPECLSAAGVFLLAFVFALFAFTEPAALGSIVLRNACAPTATRS